MDTDTLTLKESQEYRGYKIEIHYDEDNESPREWDNICVFHIAHRKYAFGDVNHNDRESIEEAENEAIKNEDIVLPLYMYEHSGITISLSPFSCPWDSGQVGIVVIPRKKMLEEFGKKIFTKKLKEKGMKIAKGEAETLDQYLCGEVYRYNIIKDNEYLDSCHGFYGEYYVVEEAKSIVDWYVKEDEKKQEEIKKMSIYL